MVKFGVPEWIHGIFIDVYCRPCGVKNCNFNQMLNLCGDSVRTTFAHRRGAISHQKYTHGVCFYAKFYLIRLLCHLCVAKTPKFYRIFVLKVLW